MQVGLVQVRLALPLLALVLVLGQVPLLVQSQVRQQELEEKRD